MSLNDDIVDIEKPDRVCSPTFVVGDISGIFLHPSTFFQRFEICIIDGVSSNF